MDLASGWKYLRAFHEIRLLVESFGYERGESLPSDLSIEDGGPETTPALSRACLRLWRGRANNSISPVNPLRSRRGNSLEIRINTQFPRVVRRKTTASRRVKRRRRHVAVALPEPCRHCAFTFRPFLYTTESSHQDPCRYDSADGE